MTLRFALSVEMISDWHIGSGQGRHRSIDRLIDRDWDDLPFIPAATIRGIWRDSAQLLARGLDDGEEGSWSKFAERLFGSEPILPTTRNEAPSLSLITLDDGRFPESMRRLLIGSEAGEKALRQALTFIKPGVAIDPRSGAAKAEFLRFEEVARSGATLEAQGAVDCADADAKAVAAFLVGAASLIERLGGKRRRGMGRCAVSVKFTDNGLPSDPRAAADILSENSEPPPLANMPVAPEKRAFQAASNASGWQKIALRLTLLSPLVAADEVQGNVITCQDYIPSSLLLGPIAGRLADAGAANVWSLIADGNIRILPATPEIGGQRSLPIPFCWEEEKGKKGDARIYRLIPRRGAPAAEGKPQHAAIRSGFVSQRVPVLHQRVAAKTLRTHNTIKDAIQRPNEDVGGVYTYEALAAGQTFWSEIWIKDGSVDIARISGEARLGRARQAGYGRVRIEAQKLPHEGFEREDKSKLLTVWLTSDAVLSGFTGAGGLDSLAGAVASELRAKPEELFDIQKSWGSLRWRRLDGWQSRWGLPRPTLIALQAGSVAELALRDGATVDAELLEAEGIGARKGEGFGCVVVNHRYLALEPEALQRKAERPGAERVGHEGPATAWERCIALRAEMAMSDETKRRAVLGWEIDANSGLHPNMSQLGTLRAVMGELTPKDLESLKIWGRRLKFADKWPPKAIEALDNLLSPQSKVWMHLELEGSEKAGRFAGAPQPRTMGFDPTSDQDLWRFAVRTLLLEAIRFHKRDGEKLSARETA